MLYCLLSILYFFSYCHYLCCHPCAYSLSFWEIAYSGFRLNQSLTHKGQSGTSQLRNDSNSWVLVELVGRKYDFFYSGLCALSIANDTALVAYPGSSQVSLFV